MEGHEGGVVERARRGDAEAFRELVETHSRAVFRLAFRMTGEEGKAEDVVQETFLKAYRNLGRFDGRAGFGTWLHRIAANCALDALRRTRREGARRSEMPEDDADLRLASSEPGPERQARSEEIGRALRQALRFLSPLERAAFSLRHFEGRSVAEICQTLGVNEGAAKQAVFRAVQKLRSEVQPLRG
jgi:RNA polymerase sigma-70 factor (ECF subfamily)